MMNRRRFFSTSMALTASSAGLGLLPAEQSSISAAEKNGRQPRVAFIGTWVKTHSHAQHFLDRLTEGYSWQGQWQKPRIDLASVYIDQFPEDDLARGRVDRHQLRLCSTIEEALTLGTGKLAVDGIVIIGEHGNYPKNEKGQTLYPRYRWFKQCVRVFEASGRSVPIFNDKHLSTEWNECVEMVDDSRRLKFPFLAGSSLPVTWRHPSVEMPGDADLAESVCVAYGGIDSYDIHALETAQCMSERRKGGESGVVRVQSLRDENVWKLLEHKDRSITQRLFIAALCRSHNLPVETGYPTSAVSLEWARSVFPKITAYHLEHADGFR
ncbi:MAG: hypothetical protein KDA91_07935, partial [Planctomycetaceae bacterium]|nr:hypothetical protein [Planctomycetaceae bacterium]